MLGPLLGPLLEAAEGDTGAIPARQAQPAARRFEKDLVEGHVGSGIERTGIEEVNRFVLQSSSATPVLSLDQS
ncbi:MAG: hypothetical protein CBC13_00115 [Planctomycetia bacterium TMED53]|nr:MAG: hypothetical protein CBC13_00115 [Planctomycetia bacterium TMED53]